MGHAMRSSSFVDASCLFLVLLFVLTASLWCWHLLRGAPNRFPLTAYRFPPSTHLLLPPPRLATNDPQMFLFLAFRILCYPFPVFRVASI